MLKDIIKMADIDMPTVMQHKELFMLWKHTTIGSTVAIIVAVLISIFLFIPTIVEAFDKGGYHFMHGTALLVMTTIILVLSVVQSAIVSSQFIEYLKLKDTK